MPRGGKRAGAGRPKGTKNSHRLHLVPFEGESSTATTAPVSRMAAMRQRVAALVYDQMAPEAIAAALGIPLRKLQIVFARELEHGHAITRAAIVGGLQAAAAAGNVAAIKRLEEMSAGNAAPVAKLGKKACADEAARAAVERGGRFVPRPAPGVAKKEITPIRAENAGAGTLREELFHSGPSPKDGLPN